MLWLALLFFADPFDGAFRAGLTALNDGNLALAESQLESASKLQPGNAKVWLALAQTYWKLNKQEASQSAAKKAEAFAKEPAVFQALAFYYSETSNFAKAADLETRYAKSEPQGYPSAVELYLRAGQPKRAIEVAHHGLMAQDRADLHHLLGKAYEAGGETATALTEYRAAIERSKYEESFYFDLAQLQLKQQSFAPALETLDDGRKYFDKSPQLELAAGVAYYGLRRFPEAIEAFLHTIQLDPSVEQPYVFLGRMLDQAEDKLPKITQVFAKFQKAAPDNYLSSFLYGKALAVQNPDQAESLLRASITKNGQFWESHFELSALLEQQGKLDQAAREIRRSVELNPNDAASHYRLARLYDRLGKTKEAQSERDLHAKLTAGARDIK